MRTATMGPPGELRTAWALMRRGLNEITRVPGAQVPGILAPTIFGLGLTAAFSKITNVGGFGTDEYFAFLTPIGFLQAAGFTGAATGVNLARDIEQGWFDRLMASPAPRRAILIGLVGSASLRVLLPVAMLLITALVLGTSFPGVAELVVSVLCACAFAGIAAAWSTVLALKFRTQQAAPLMQMSVFILVLFSPSYAPQSRLQPWLRTVSEWNPVTPVVKLIRSAFTYHHLPWELMWPAMLSLTGLAVLTVFLASRGLRRMSY